MPKLKNTITGKINWMPASYVGQFPYKLVDEAPVAEPIEIQKSKKSKKKVEYVPNAVDSDGDGKVQDGTVFERPVGEELSPEKVTELSAGSEE